MTVIGPKHLRRYQLLCVQIFLGRSLLLLPQLQQPVMTLEGGIWLSSLTKRTSAIDQSNVGYA